jgi:hypothetical protein
LGRGRILTTRLDGRNFWITPWKITFPRSTSSHFSFVPEPAGNLDRINAKVVPPRRLVAALVKITMMPSAERHHPLVADFSAEGLWLCETEVMGIGRLLAAQ